MPLYVTKIDEGSPAQKLGLSLGCALLAVDGHPLNDALDYQFYTPPAAFSLDVCELMWYPSCCRRGSGNMKSGQSAERRTAWEKQLPS